MKIIDVNENQLNSNQYINYYTYLINRPRIFYQKQINAFTKHGKHKNRIKKPFRIGTNGLAKGGIFSNGRMPK